MSTLFADLTWWQVGLLVIYIIYTIVRAWAVFSEGIKDAIIGYGNRDIKLYHILWFIVDIPAVILGGFFPILKRFFNIRLYTLQEKKKEQK